MTIYIHLRKIFCGIVVFALVIFMAPSRLKAQDIQYSQFYANVLYLNPAFAGSAHSSRGMFHQRVQWPALDAKYLTSHFSADHYFKNTNSGLGLMAFKDWQGANNITTTEIALQYSYELHLSSKHSFRAGLQASYVSRNVDYSMLRFPDQYDSYGYLGPRTHQPTDTDMIHYLDFTSGGLFYSDKYWVSFAYAHMNQPNQSFYGGDSRLPAKVSITGGYRFNLKPATGAAAGSNMYLTPTLHYKTQGESDQVDIGLYFLYDYIIAGLWYRGIPLVKRYRPGLHNNESAVAVIGFKVSNSLSISYSYDFVVSKLTRAQTGGSHELNITYLHNLENLKRRTRKLPCPKF
ncbi:type IX secretion system membrane protein PorP/SprF [Cytophagaceae bacterium ABcell3]|nr:type IX secretion system membrane protein PorP/SprF [Cytophagaceae bacterium ABcell3]